MSAVLPLTLLFRPDVPDRAALVWWLAGLFDYLDRPTPTSLAVTYGDPSEALTVQLDGGVAEADLTTWPLVHRPDGPPAAGLLDRAGWRPPLARCDRCVAVARADVEPTGPAPCPADCRPFLHRSFGPGVAPTGVAATLVHAAGLAWGDPPPRSLRVAAWFEGAGFDGGPVAVDLDTVAEHRRLAARAGGWGR